MSLEELELGVELELEPDEVSLDGVELDEDDGVLLEDDGLALEPLVEDEPLLLGEVLELGGVALLELELLGLVLLGLLPMEPELEPLLEDGLDLLPMDDEPLELDEGEVLDVSPREAPVLEPGPLLQP